MKAYLSFLKLRLNVGLQYRFAAIAGILTQFFFGVMYLFIYEAYYRANISIGMEWQALVSYLWLNQIFFYLTYFNLIDGDIYDSIVTGQVSYELVRPLSVYWLWYVKLLAKKIAGAALRFLPVLVVAMLLPSKYALQAPVSVAAFLLFLVTLFLGVILSICIGMIIYGFMFYTTSSRGLFSIYTAIADFLAGGTIPIVFMPPLLQKICYALPFRLTIDLPFRLYVGNISVEEGVVSVVKQVVWIAITMVLGLVLMKHSQKKLVVQGG
ncbi:MAG: ABC-2 family transporter protein [Clostridia bacterium]|nr:ABC-2 family transporter protein [Clostridia bacterium]